MKRISGKVGISVTNRNLPGCRPLKCSLVRLEIRHRTSLRTFAALSSPPVTAETVTNERSRPNVDSAATFLRTSDMQISYKLSTFYIKRVADVTQNSITFLLILGRETLLPFFLFASGVELDCCLFLRRSLTEADGGWGAWFEDAESPLSSIATWRGLFHCYDYGIQHASKIRVNSRLLVSSRSSGSIIPD